MKDMDCFQSGLGPKRRGGYRASGQVTSEEPQETQLWARSPLVPPVIPTSPLPSEHTPEGTPCDAPPPPGNWGGHGLCLCGEAWGCHHVRGQGPVSAGWVVSGSLCCL